MKINLLKLSAVLGLLGFFLASFFIYKLYQPSSSSRVGKILPVSKFKSPQLTKKILTVDSNSNRKKSDERRPAGKKIQKIASRRFSRAYMDPREDSRLIFLHGSNIMSSEKGEADDNGKYTKTTVYQVTSGFKAPYVAVEEYYQTPSIAVVGGKDTYQGNTIMAADQVLVRLQDGKFRPDLEQYLKEIGGSIINQLALSGETYLIQLQSHSPGAVEEMIQKLMDNTELVDISQPNYVVVAN